MKKIFGTHSGAFHADDVFAIAALSILYPEYEIKRSREQKIWDQCDFLVDVGGFYDHENKKYDHHFNGGPTYDDGLPMSSIGMIWLHYGEEICGSSCVANRVCHKLIRQLDANDNGVALTTKLEGAPDVREISLSGSIAMMNPKDHSLADDAFAAEVVRAKALLNSAISSAQHWIDSKAGLNEALQIALKNDLKFIEVPEDCKWTEHLFNSDNNESILYAIYPHGEKWYIRAVPSTPGEFSNRKNLPKSWSGLRDSEFSNVADIPDGIFCHHGLFICAANSHESILKLVNKAIDSK